jgi:indole-3-glycerol phosphate synthase
LHRSDKGLAEVEEAWACRDKGFNCAWISEALYKAGNSASEHPGAIIKSMVAKASVKWASPVARSGRGEGAREYLGDILM